MEGGEALCVIVCKHEASLDLRAPKNDITVKLESSSTFHVKQSACWLNSHGVCVHFYVGFHGSIMRTVLYGQLSIILAMEISESSG